MLTEVIQTEARQAVRNQGLAKNSQPEPYAPYAQRVFVSFGQPGAVTTESDVAEVVWRAANDATGQLRFPAGADVVALAQSR